MRPGTINPDAREQLPMLAAPVLAVALLGSGCGGSSERSDGSSSALPLRVVEAPTPRLPVRDYVTEGAYPQVARRGARGVDVRAVNAALREAVLADQRAYAPFARKWRRIFARDNSVYATEPGLYSTTVDRSLVAASTVVVSAVLPTLRERARGEGGREWLAMIVDVPSAKQVTIGQLFTDPSRGLRALRSGWEARVGPCRVNYRAVYDDAAGFALLPAGVAVAVPRVAVCGRDVTIVPFRLLRAYLNQFGASLVDGVRAPA